MFQFRGGQAAPATTTKSTMSIQRFARPLSQRSSLRAFSSSPRRLASQFDTSALVVALEKQGLTRQQAVGVMAALEEVVRDSVSNMVSHLVTRAEVEKYQYTQKVSSRALF